MGVTKDNTGRYSRVFLDELFGSDRYRVRSFKLNMLAQNTIKRQEVEDALTNDETLSLAYVSDTKLVMVWLKDHPGWLSFCEPTGIDITPSAKIAKRLTMFTRLAYLYKRFELGELRIRRVPVDGYSDYVPEQLDDESHAERFLDGANVISRETLEQLITQASGSHRGDPWVKEAVNTAVDNAGSFSIRVSTPDGQIKGDCLVADRDKMGGYDLLYCDENIKHEFKTNDFVFVLLEPHPGHRTHAFSPDEAAPHPVWSDVQSMSWLGEWLYPYQQLKSCLKDFITNVADELRNDIYPAFFTAHEKIDDPYSTISAFQRQALRWQKRGPGRNEPRHHPRAGTSLGQSIFLQERIAHGAINMLTSKMRWPVPCAIYVHVASDSWLHMAGYSGGDEHPWPFKGCHTPRGKVWLHEETGRLIYNDKDFVELYERHGGWDLDDSVKAHYRTWRGNKVVVTVRSPNSWGEYDIKDYVPGTYAPTWQQADGTEMSFPELDDERPEFLEEMDVNYRYKSLSPSAIGSDADPHALQGKHYTREMVSHALETAIEFRTVFGRYSNAEMTYFYTVGDYRSRQLAPIEAIVDACTQEQSETARALIVTEIDKMIEEMVDHYKQHGTKPDRTLWKERMKRFHPEMSYTHGDYTKLSSTHQDLCALYKTKLFDIAQSAVDEIDPQIIELGELAATKGKELVTWYYSLARQTAITPVEADEDGDDDELRATAVAERYRKINDIMCGVLEQLDDVTVYNLVLGMANYVYTTPRGSQYKDTPLFQTGSPGHNSVFDYYLDAIEFYGIGDDNWTATDVCSECGVNRMYTDALEYQRVLYEGCCADCW